MTSWLPDIAGKPGPKYKRIADAIGEGIAAGDLTERDRLPPQRNLAFDIGVSLNTVSRAYADAIERGFLYGEVGRGTYVRAGGPLQDADGRAARLTRPTDGPIDFALNLPAISPASDYLATTLGDLAGSPRLNTFLDYQPDGDLKDHVKAGAAWLGRLGPGARAEQIVLTSGAQHGVMVAMLATMRPGDVLLTEPMTYAPAKAMARHMGLKLHAVAMDGYGLLPEALNDACRTTAGRTLYCLPTLHTPTTATMPAERRREIAAVARRHDLTIIEDDVFGFLPTERPLPLVAFAPERTIFVTSVSKSMAPGLRIGYVHAPERLQRAIRGAVAMSCWMPPPLMAEIASRWVEDGTADRLNDGQRVEAKARLEIAARLLGADRFEGQPLGFNIWLPLPAPIRADAFRAEAARRGVKVLTGETFAVDQTDVPHGVRLCLSYETSRERVSQGLRIVAALLNEADDPDAMVV